MSHFIDSEYCSECNEQVWFDHGDIIDFTAPDVEAVRCPHCGHQFWIVGPELRVDPTCTDPGEGLIVDGYKTPREAIGRAMLPGNTANRDDR